MRFASLGSGSRGNSLVVDSGDTKLLIDCGFSLRMTLSRLVRLGISGEDISAILVTHEHSDHIAGVARFAGHFKVPVYLTHGTCGVLYENDVSVPDPRLVDGHSGFRVGDFSITPYTVPHDAREPVQYVVSCGQLRLGILTDCGTVTPHIVEVLDGADGLVLECNHDAGMLAGSAYPAMLKRRIASDFGHLANAQSVSLLQRIDRSRLQHVVAAHLSEENNHPELVVAALLDAIASDLPEISVASQDEGLGWCRLV
jgi:phosphoribosyl 1,2-cyclic phosphodiesterase